MTASTLYEAVEPSILWKQLLAAIMNDLTEDKQTGVSSVSLRPGCRQFIQTPFLGNRLDLILTTFTAIAR